MKRIFIAIAAVLLAMSISTNVFAHSHLGGSNPADGDIISEPLKEIVLEFDGKIEQGSYIDITTTKGKAIELQEIIIGDGTLTGTVSEPLPNEKYQVNWSIISADGHPLEGKFSFTVNVPVTESVEEVQEKPSVTNESAVQSTEGKEQAAPSDEVEKEKESSSMTVILIVLLVIIIAVIFFLLTKRKK
ncbi:copper resistance CopC family protein [Cytobacillus massiliigabonensis]|uniref:copper resistance CopC family protein n=1 Tax=Cytobacillus massiliigabonensis TaxID=1871011 RepID=UPI000C819963|nr:copper resistance CopC family protein [Cytobacillus massiliigabonensis]